MRWNYFMKTLVKSIALLTVIIFVLAVVYDTSSKAKDELENTDWQPSPLREAKALQNGKDETGLTQIEIFRKKFFELQTLAAAKKENEIESGGPYLTSGELEVEEFKADLSEYRKLVRFHERFWDLAIPSDTNASLTKKNTKPLMYDNPVNLWRPVNGQEGVKNTDRIVEQLVWQMEAANSSFAKNFKPKTILIWDTFEWWSKASWQNEDPKELHPEDCHHTPGSIGQCIFTDDQSKIGGVQAIVTARDSFHTHEVNVPEHVLKFNFILESPFHSSATLTRGRDLLASFWRGSDVVTPYAKWVYYDLNMKLKPQGKDYTVGKTKPVAIFVSNCNAWNDRMGYVRSLQKSIQVDVYGNCGSLSCSRANEKTCFNQLKTDYYFYLSFENSNCRDYITEKLFTNGLGNDVVPVVMGAHPDDVKAMAPYKSYIHVEEFDDPIDLGVYLNYLIQNPKEYNKYYEWKGTGEFVSTELFCRLCAMVHYAGIVEPPKRDKTYSWGHRSAISDGMCLKNGRWYWTKNNTKPGASEILKRRRGLKGSFDDVL